MQLEQLTPLQRRRFTLHMMEQVEYSLVMTGDMERSFALESLEGLHPFSGRQRYLEVLQGSYDPAAQAMVRLLQDEDNWVDSAQVVIQKLRATIPPSEAALTEELEKIKLRLG